MSGSTGPDRETLVGTLDELVELCADGIHGFRAAAEAVEDPDLQRLCRSFAEQRAEFAAELRREVRRLGGTPQEEGHPAAALHRGWMRLRAVAGSGEQAVLDECERGEDAAVRGYQRALETGVSGDVRLLIERQYLQVREAHAHVRALRDAHARRG